MSPVSRDRRLRGAKRITATAFCVPLATKSVLPSGAKTRAFGEAPKRSAGLGLAQIVSTAVSVAVSTTVRLSDPALAQTR